MSSKLTKMAIAAIPPGRELPDGGYDYSHVIAPEHQKDYKIQVRKRVSKQFGSEYHAELYHHKNGFRNPIGSVEGQDESPTDLRINFTRIGPVKGNGEEVGEHRGKHLGRALYEALYSFAKNHLGKTHIMGDKHSTLAMYTHASLARKHGLEYKAQALYGKDSGYQYEDLEDWMTSPNKAFDNKYGPYRYAIKDELDPDGETEIASCAVFNSSGELLFGRRNDNGRWTLPGGHLESKETPRVAAERELLEETGLEATGWGYLGEGLAGKFRIYCFAAQVEDVEADGIDDPDNECDEWRWVDIMDGLPEEIANNLHSRKNITLRLLDLQEGEIEKSEPDTTLGKVSLTSEATANRMTPHQPYGSEVYDRVETYQLPNGHFHHVFYKAPYEAGGQSVMHSLSTSQNPLHEGYATSASGLDASHRAGEWPANSFLNNPWKDNHPVVVHGETASRGPKGSGTLLYQSMLRVHGRMASDSGTSAGANGVWEKLARDPQFKVSLGYEKGHRHWAEYQGSKPNPVSVIEGDGRSIEDMIKQPIHPYEVKVQNFKLNNGGDYIEARAHHKETGQSVGYSGYHVDHINKKLYTVGPYHASRGVAGGSHFDWDHKSAHGVCHKQAQKLTGYKYGGDLPSEIADQHLPVKKSEAEPGLLDQKRGPVIRNHSDVTVYDYSHLLDHDDIDDGYFLQINDSTEQTGQFGVNLMFDNQVVGELYFTYLTERPGVVQAGPTRIDEEHDKKDFKELMFEGAMVHAKQVANASWIEDSEGPSRTEAVYRKIGKSLNKSLKEKLMGAVAAAAVMASPASGGGTHEPNATREAHQAPYAKAKAAKWSPDGLHPEMHAIAHLESSFGKRLEHMPHSKGEYHSAFGAVGFKPVTAHEEYKRTPAIQKLYPNLHDQHKFIESFKKNPAFYNLMATTHWNRLKKLASGDVNKAAYSWRWGPTAARRVDPTIIASDPYVQAYTQLRAKLSAKSVLAAKSSFDNAVGEWLTKAEKAKPSKFWKSKDGIKIPVSGTFEREVYNQKFFKATDEVFGTGLGRELRVVYLNPADLHGTNMAVNQERLGLYTRMAKANEPLPPIVVQREGNAMVVKDGNHRVEAALKAGNKLIKAYEVVVPDVARKADHNLKLYDMGDDPHHLANPSMRETEHGVFFEPVEMDTVHRKLIRMGYHGYKNHDSSNPHAIKYFTDEDGHGGKD